MDEAKTNPYEEKRQRRIARLRARAEKREHEAAARVETADRMASVIPMGQPILVGHHSEGRDRRYRDKIHNNYQRGFEAQKEAEALRRRADAAEDSSAISSDDPDAIQKLEARIAELEAQRIRYRALNTACRSREPRAALAKLGASDALASELLTPDFAERVGIPAYVLSNLSGNIRRLKLRIAEIERARIREGRRELYGAVSVVEEDNRVRVVFPGKPSEAIRRALKQRGFRFSPTAGAWQKHPSEWAWFNAREVVWAYFSSPA
jgi:hypothetical protein